MSEELMNTKEVAQYLGVHEKQVYLLIKENKIPSTRVTGKWIFPKHLIDEWIEANAQKGLGEARQKGKRIEGALLAAGSNDPILDILHTHLRKVHPEFYIFSTNTGSVEGLKALDKGYTDIAWSHLFDPQTGEYNLPFLPSYLPNINPVAVNLFCRELGFVVTPKNPLGIRTFADLAVKGVKFINRQKGAGTRVLIDYHLQQSGIAGNEIDGYENEVFTHFEVGLSILSKEADAGIATCAIAKLLGLGFVPITQESFDMIMDKSVFFGKGVQAFLEVLNSVEFKAKVAGLGNYDFNKSGKIIYN
ncbi:MAG: helix-turn-helix transcriptional regulator [Syntrophales bacterium LBB04]|nr:helix-turn-helix transcriptional regulator [Syntrophales bacterium LBB04]